MTLFTKRNIIWGLGFVLLILVNIIVERFLLPYWGLDNTDKNDIYFKSWWIVVGLWLLFGRMLLKFVDRKSGRK
ncbi:MAG: hypothetical protein ABFS16_06260 [Bacteroidota bacterium]